jgi:hypothetical protein
LAQHARGGALELCRQRRRSHPRITLDKHMYVVRHDFQGMQRDMPFISFDSQQHFQPFCHRSHQERLAILGTENEVIFERKDCASLACIPLMFPTKSRAVCSMKNTYLTPGKGRAVVCGILVPSAQRRFLCQLKQAVPSPISYGAQMSSGSHGGRHACPRGDRKAAQAAASRRRFSPSQLETIIEPRW